MNLFANFLPFLMVFYFFDISTDQKLDVVDHKNMQLKLYLDAIQYNLQEKIGILPYVLQKQSGIYLEIGTGGDPIAELMKGIPKEWNIKIIASDVDQNVLDSLLIRHPELQIYVDAQTKVKLQLQQLNAIDMNIFSDNYLDGINASSVVHEIVSYAGGHNGSTQFFQEAFRILKTDGILIYRDPEFINNEKEVVSVVLKNKIVKLFTHVFLYKFLDHRGSILAQKNRKVFMYDLQKVQFHFYKKNEQKFNSYSYEEYLKTPSYDIDFSRKYSVSLPCGLYRELSRHYLTYLHACNPLMYLKSIPNIASGTYFINYLAHSTTQTLKNFLNQHLEQLKDEQLTLAQKNLIEFEIEKNCQVLEFGIPLKFTSKSKEIALRKLLNDYDIDPSLHIIAIDNRTCLLDYRIFGMLYEQIRSLFDFQNKIENFEDEKHAAWLKREGEEYYCYWSADSLITQVLLATLEKSQEKSQKKEDLMVLCPLDKEHNKFLNRWCYSELLKETLDVYDTMDYPIDVFDGKRIIHFKKMPLKDAIDICEKIITEEPSVYPQLTKILNKLKVNEYA